MPLNSSFTGRYSHWMVELNEKNGGRHQSFVIENEDLVRANTINELQVR